MTASSARPALRRELGRVAHLGVDDAVVGQVLGALGGHPRDGLGRLHDRHRVAEAFEVELQGLAVGARAEPAPQLGSASSLGRSP